MTQRFTNDARQVFAFSPGIKRATRGSSIRGHYILTGLQERGFKVEAFERDIFPRTAIHEALADADATVLLSNIRLPFVLAKSAVAFFEGLPSSSLAKALLGWAHATGIGVVLDFCDDPLLQHRDLMGREPPHAGRLRNLRQAFFDAANHVIFPSEGLKNYYLKLGLLSEAKTSVSTNSSDPDHFETRPLPSEPTIGMVSGCAPGRGFEVLIDACELARKIIPGLRLEIATSPVTMQQREYLHGLTSSFTRDWISFRLDVDYRNVSRFLSRCYACVVPHPNTFYMNIALPIKLFDYMAAGRPVIVSNCLEMSDVVSKERCGLVYDFSPSDLASKLVAICSDRPRAESMGQNGRHAIETKFNWASRANEVSEILTGMGLQRQMKLGTSGLNNATE